MERDKAHPPPSVTPTARCCALLTLHCSRGILILQNFEILNFAWCQIMAIGSLISELFSHYPLKFISKSPHFLKGAAAFQTDLA